MACNVVAGRDGTITESRRLESWKEIAAYLGRDVRTAQRWERGEGLPVHRLQHSRLGSVFAHTVELDAWREARDSVAHHVQGKAGDSRHGVRRRVWIAVACSAIVVTLVVGVWRLSDRDMPLSGPAQVGVNVTPGEPARLETMRTVVPGAYASYLKGLFSLNHGADSVVASVREFEQATARDPTFAPAYVGLAAAYEALGGTAVGLLPVADARPKAIAAASRALELDPHLARAHAILARAHQQEWRWEEAEAEYRRSIEIDPNDSVAHGRFGALLVWRGRTEEGLAYARRARGLDPLSMQRTVDLGWLLYHARRYDDAVAELQTVLAVQPDHRGALWFLAFALIDSRRVDEAIEVLEYLAVLRNRNPAELGLLARAYGRAGRRTDALRIVEELHRRERIAYVPPAPFVHAYVGLDDRDRAFEVLERAYQERSNIVQFLGTHPLYDTLRPDPRFADLLRRVHLE